MTKKNFPLLVLKKLKEAEVLATSHQQTQNLSKILCTMIEEYRKPSTDQTVNHAEASSSTAKTFINHNNKRPRQDSLSPIPFFNKKICTVVDKLLSALHGSDHHLKALDNFFHENDASLLNKDLETLLSFFVMAASPHYHIKNYPHLMQSLNIPIAIQTWINTLITGYCLSTNSILVNNNQAQTSKIIAGLMVYLPPEIADTFIDRAMQHSSALTTEQQLIADIISTTESTPLFSRDQVIKFADFLIARIQRDLGESSSQPLDFFQHSEFFNRTFTIFLKIYPLLPDNNENYKKIISNIARYWIIKQPPISCNKEKMALGKNIALYSENLKVRKEEIPTLIKIFIRADLPSDTELEMINLEKWHLKYEHIKYFITEEQAIEVHNRLTTSFLSITENLQLQSNKLPIIISIINEINLIQKNISPNKNALLLENLEERILEIYPLLINDIVSHVRLTADTDTQLLISKINCLISITAHVDSRTQDYIAKEIFDWCCREEQLDVDILISILFNTIQYANSEKSDVMVTQGINWIESLLNTNPNPLRHYKIYILIQMIIDTKIKNLALYKFTFNKIILKLSIDKHYHRHDHIIQHISNLITAEYDASPSEKIEIKNIMKSQINQLVITLLDNTQQLSPEEYTYESRYAISIIEELADIIPKNNIFYFFHNVFEFFLQKISAANTDLIDNIRIINILTLFYNKLSPEEKNAFLCLVDKKDAAIENNIQNKTWLDIFSASIHAKEYYQSLAIDSILTSTPDVQIEENLAKLCLSFCHN